MQPTIGRIVHYTLNAGDAEAINRRRKDFADSQSAAAATGFVGHVGNQAEAGQVYPAMVVRVFDPRATTANLQVLLDGNDSYWATSRTERDGEGGWAWPPRA